MKPWVKPELILSLLLEFSATSSYTIGVLSFKLFLYRKLIFTPKPEHLSELKLVTGKKKVATTSFARKLNKPFIYFMFIDIEQKTKNKLKSKKFCIIVIILELDIFASKCLFICQVKQKQSNYVKSGVGFFYYLYKLKTIFLAK